MGSNLKERLDCILLCLRPESISSARLTSQSLGGAQSSTSNWLCLVRGPNMTTVMVTDFKTEVALGRSADRSSKGTMITAIKF